MSRPASNPDSADIRAVLELMAPRLRMVLARYQIPPADGEDLIQEAVLVTLSRWAEIHNKQGWLLITLRNLCTVYLRRQKCWTRLIESMDPQCLQALAVAMAPSQPACDTSRDLRKLLATLDARERQLLYLRYCENLGPSEVASRLGCHPASVRRMVLRLVARLKAAAVESAFSGFARPRSAP
jgi:RNA polymerase sigma factor (sigma-70 family)